MALGLVVGIVAKFLMPGRIGAIIMLALYRVTLGRTKTR